MVGCPAKAAVAAPSRALSPFPRVEARDRATQRPSAPEDIMKRYSPRRPQAAPRWFVAAWLTAAALMTAASAVLAPASAVTQ